MSTEDLTAQCDCIAFGDGDAQAHQVTCALWDNPLFANGTADWDPGLQELVLVHPIHQSLHDMTDEEVALETGGADDEPSEEELSKQDFEDRCQAHENDLWESMDSGVLDWPPYNYTIDGISRVFNIEQAGWQNAQLGCHCDPPEETSCVICGVYREDPDGSYWQKQWKPQIVRPDDIMCRCEKQSQWNCIKCGVKRPVGPVDDAHSEAGQLARPMERWDPTMAKKKTKPKGGVTAWSGWNTGKTGKPTVTYVQCRHKGRELVFPNGQKIYGSSASAKAPEGYEPDFGIYLDSTWFHNAVNLGIMLPWQDMGLPKLSRECVDTAVTLACQMMERGDTIEVGCIGGHGRTGTFLALVAMRNGVETPEEAIKYIREKYCDKAIESATQEWYIEAWYAEENGLPVPEKPVAQSWSNHDSTYQTNKGKPTKKTNDGQFIWYCPKCQADCDDDADSCYWCLAEFENPGIRPADEWHKQNTPKEVLQVSERIEGPWKLIEAKKRKPPKPKAVTAGAKTTEPSLPFDQDEVDEVMNSLTNGGWGGYV